MQSSQVEALLSILLVELEVGQGVGRFAVVGGCHPCTGRPAQDAIAKVLRCLRVAYLGLGDQTIDDLGQGIDNPSLDRLEGLAYFSVLGLPLIVLPPPHRVVSRSAGRGSSIACSGPVVATRRIGA
jgi:hypothetical protein